uniref:SAM-dependent methyltransferase n=1 Tax=Leptotrichia massiliensis TaxID=1852388 RepID=UPI00391F2682
DVSFISLTKVIPYFEKFLAKNAKIIMLVKPQFEVGREKIGKNGVVENEEYHDEAIKKIISFSKKCGYELIGVEDSPIKGAKGNKEFLMLLTFS